MRLKFFALLAFALPLAPLAQAADAPAVASLQELDAIPYPRHVVAPVVPAGLGPVVDRVEVAFTIDAQGNVGRVAAVSGANPALREAAVAAITQWHFDPPSRGGRPTEVAARQVFAFGPPKDAASQEMIMPEAVGSAPPPPAARSGFLSFLYFLLPKAFQANPTIHLTVITETTGEGRKVAAATTEHPTYYSARTYVVPDQGDADTVPPDQLRGSLGKALALDHYLPAGPGHPAAQMLVFSWGIAAEVARPDEPLNQIDQIDVLGRQFVRENYLARVKLVGGDAFARQVVEAINQHEANPVGAGGPLKVLAGSNALARQLLELAMADSYFVVASAYDAELAARGQRRLLWQTKLTVNSQDLAMTDALTALIRNGGPYFGREMSQVEILSVPLQAGGDKTAAR